MLWNETEYSGWGGVLRASGRLARPERASGLEALMRETPGPAMGLFRSYGDTALNDGGDGIVMTRLDRFLAFDEDTGVLDAEAGVSIGEIMRIFAPRGWLPKVMPGTGFATLGGCIANDVHGKNHHVDGSFGATVASLVLMGPDGKSRRISPKRDAALFKATFGGLGLTGVITTARIRLMRTPSRAMEVRESRIDTLGEFIDALEASESRFTVGWIDATAKDENLGRGILEEGDFAEYPLDVAEPPRSRTVPFNFPGFALSAPVVRAFNALYFRRVPAEGRSRIRSYASFFHPLDNLRQWNRLYGKRGFHQFQCVVPLGNAEAVLQEMLETISASGLASPLAVLKKMGPGRTGPMSFPMAGFTLAVDFSARAKTPGLLRTLESLTLAAGGRVYLAKDALTSRLAIADMYPEIEAFRVVVRKADPDGVFETDMARRLALRVAP